MADQDWNGRVQTITLERLAQVDSVAQQTPNVSPEQARKIAAYKIGITPTALKHGMTLG